MLVVKILRATLLSFVLAAMPLVALAPASPAGASSQTAKFCAVYRAVEKSNPASTKPSFTSAAWHQNARRIVPLDRKLVALAPTAQVRTVMSASLRVLAIMLSAHTQAQWNADMLIAAKTLSTPSMRRDALAVTPILLSCH